MKCENCNRETRGIKLNGKIFCTYCGEIVKDSTEILEEAYEHTPPQPSEKFETEPKRVSKEGEIIHVADEVELLEAEEEVLELIEENNKEKKKEKKPVINNKKIIKQNRNRAGMIVVPGEPDPIEELELEPPHDDQIESPGLDSGINLADEKTNFPLHNNQQKEEINKSIEVNQAPLNESQKIEEAVEPIKAEEAPPTEEPEEPKKPDGPEEEPREITPPTPPTKEIKKKTKKPKKRKSGKRKKWPLIVSVIFLALLSLAGLVYYVTNYAVNEDYIEKKITTNAGIIHTKPSYITPGYKLSYLSDSSEDYIEYKYVQITGDDFITFRAEKTEVSNEDIYDIIIKPQKTYYKNIKINEVDVWEVDSGKIYFIKNDILYTLTSSANLSSEIRKIAEGVIN